MRAWLLHPIRSWRRLRRLAYIGGLIEGMWKDYAEVPYIRKTEFGEDVAQSLLRLRLTRELALAMDKHAAKAFRDL